MGERLRRYKRALLWLPFVGALVRDYDERLTARGRYLFWTFSAFALMGLDTRRTQIYVLFAAAAGLFVMAWLHMLRRRPAVQLEGRLPARATTLQPVSFRVTVRSDSPKLLPDLRLAVRRPEERGGERLELEPSETFLAVEPGRTTDVTVTLRAQRRGRYLLRGPGVSATDPLGLAGGQEARLSDELLIAYPRFWTLDEFRIPLGRRYQPGGIPLSSSTGDAIEFVGTRDYREGDPVKNIHWRSWARRGQPVVKEYQEEYFCRIAIILDTFLPDPPAPGLRGPPPQQLQGFESGISVVASIADYFSRSEYIVDILAAGPDVYEVSAGRSLAYLENILDVLACLEPCHDPPFAGIGPALFDKLAQITTVVAVLQDWDEPREAFLRKVKALGTAVRAIVVHEGPTSRSFAHVGEELGEISTMSLADVERALTASARP